MLVQVDVTEYTFKLALLQRKYEQVRVMGSSPLICCCTLPCPALFDTLSAYAPLSVPVAVSAVAVGRLQEAQRQLQLLIL
jgi:hypothetical protein